MSKTWSVTALLVSLCVSPRSLPAQDVVLPGSTVQGDVLRGQGQFLKGAAWYELNAAKARSIDVRTAPSWTSGIAKSMRPISAS